ncbi:MAG: aldose 1-epimerase [Chloroflexi bacterium]|nr:aldose 1-epimerase [Chloroflexota bacterium]
MTFRKPRNHGCRISDDWTYKGMRTVVLENELLRVTILVDKGSDIVEFRYKPLDLDFLHYAPGGIRNPTRETPSAYSTSPFLDFFSGGWNEILPNGGPFVTYKGADLGQHGEISLIPWDYAIVEDRPERVAVRLWVRPLRTPFFLEKTLMMEPERPVLHISETLVNEAGEPVHLMWGHHIAFGRPFLDEGAVIDTPARRFIVHGHMQDFEPRRFKPEAQGHWPHIEAADGTALADASIVPAYGTFQAQEMAYLTDLTDGWYAITNTAKEVGFAIHFDPELFRYVWYWQQLGDVAQGYPWWGRTHTAALEPWTSYPTGGLQQAIANKTALLLQPGQQIETTLTAIAYQGLTRVHDVSADGQVRGSKRQETS